MMSSTAQKGGSMRPKIIIAIILIALGIAALAYQGITYTTREKVVDLGPIQMTAEKSKTIPLPPILGAIAIAGGIVLLVVGGRKV
jgi:flagellar basal body-associated protein FliL